MRDIIEDGKLLKEAESLGAVISTYRDDIIWRHGYRNSAEHHNRIFADFYEAAEHFLASPEAQTARDQAARKAARNPAHVHAMKQTRERMRRAFTDLEGIKSPHLERTESEAFFRLTGELLALLNKLDEKWG